MQPPAEAANRRLCSALPKKNGPHIDSKSRNCRGEMDFNNPRGKLGGSDPPYFFADKFIVEEIWGSLGAQDPGSEVREVEIIEENWI